MAGRSGYKRKLEDFDPNASDPEDQDYGVESSPRPRSKAQSRKPNRGSPKKPSKRRRETYNDSDIDQDSDVDTEDEASYHSPSEDDEPVELNPRTGRGVRSVAKKPIKYEEKSEEDEDIRTSDSDRDPLQPTPPRSKRSQRAAPRKESLIIKLKLPGLRMDRGGKYTRTRATSRPLKREPTPQAPGAALTRRSSRLSHDEQQPLVALTDSGKHEVVTRAATATPEPETGRRPSRSSKGLKKPPSAIMEASQESSFANPPVGTNTAEGNDFFSQLEGAARDDDAQQASQAGADLDEDIRMGYEEDEEEEMAEEPVIPESQPDPDVPDDDDDEPVSRGGRTLRNRRKASTPLASQPISNTRRSLRNRKAGAEQSSDFEPDAEGEADVEENVSDSDHLRPPRGRSSAEASSQGGRRSGRLTRKAASNRSRSRRSPDDDELDVEEIADEAAELDEDNRRNRRSRKRSSQRQPREQGITFETNLRNRGNRPDYRILRPELLLPVDDDDGPAAATVTPQRARRGGGGGHTYRSLFSTFGPFGGAGGPPPVFGGPDGIGATGGVDSDSSDDEMGGTRGGQQGNVGGAVGMTPTSAFPKPYMPPAPALNNEPTQGPGGGPPGLGKVKDRKALADADPLGVDPNVTFDGVGGLDNHINQLKEMVTLPLLYPEVFQRFHTTPPRGVLFHGPPGTGKTLLARALASSVSSQGRKVTFYMRKGADALSKWVGEAEKQLRLLFEEARKNQPSIIFFDEIDGLAPVRSSKQEQIHASIVATLLALMDGMDGRGQVIVIGATNRPDSVDPALRRPGRFDREFYFPLPDVPGRRKILDIHTKGWDPPLKNEFKDQLAELTRGYGGADLRALCTEAALNAVQGTYPQIYTSDQKLIIDPAKIKVLAKDFMLSVNKIVPSSERSAASGAAPLKKNVEPLLRDPLAVISNRIDQAIPRKRKATALEEAMYDDRDDELGFQKETMQREFEASRVFRPRLLITGSEGMGQQYLGAALLSKFEGLHVQNFDLPTLLKDSTRSPEAAVVQLFEEVKRHKPSVIYIPNVNIWYDTVPETAKRTFIGLLKSLQPTDPILLLGIMEMGPEGKPDSQMLRELFQYSMKNIYTLPRPSKEARQEFFDEIVAFIRKAPSEFPDMENRKRRRLEELPVAPPAEEPAGPSKAELKAQKKKDHQTLNMLKLHIGSVMDQIKLKYRKFRTPIIEDSAIAYLFDEKDPQVLTTDLTEDQRQQQQLFRPYEVEKDDKGVEGLREVASGKFYYNLEIVTIEKRLSNGYYKRPKDFLADIKRLAKDAKTSGDQDRTLKANEMLANVEVDMATLETTQAALCAECEAVHEREQLRERDLRQKMREAERRGEEVPTIVPNVPPFAASKTTTETSGPVMLGQEVPGRHLFHLKPGPSRPGDPSPSNHHWSTTQTNGSHDSHLTNGSTVPSKPQEDSEMVDAQVDSQFNTQSKTLPSTQAMPTQGATYHGQSQNASQAPFTQDSAHTRLQAGSQVEQYENSASTTNSGQKSSDRSSGATNRTNGSNGIGPGLHPDFITLGNFSGGSQLPDTQPPSVLSQQASRLGSGGSAGSGGTGNGPPLSQNSVSSHSQSSQQMGPPRQSPRALSIHSVLNDDGPEEEASSRHQMILDEGHLLKFQQALVDRTSGTTVEQLEQIHAACMNVIWEERGNWNRNRVWTRMEEIFNGVIEDIEECQVLYGPSQPSQDT